VVISARRSKMLRHAAAITRMWLSV